MKTHIAYGNGIHAIDAEYARAQFAAIHLIVDNGRAAFVDTGANSSVPAALAALTRLGLTPDAVDYVILTHIHLDHAGGAGALMAACPQAKLVVHPRGARHVIDPSKLMAATREVYGTAKADALYGTLLPIAAERVIEVSQGDTLHVGQRTLSIHDCPGHAKHHIFIHDHQARAVFTGDTFGISYRECDVDGRAFLFPSSTPSQFDPVAMRDSITRMLACAPEAMYLTHYSRLSPPTELAATVLRRLDAMVAMVPIAKEKVSRCGTALDFASLNAALHAALSAYLLSEARAHGVRLSDEALLDLWKMDLDLDAQGLAIWALG